MRSIRTILVATIAVTLLTTTRPALASVSDPWITAKTKLALLTAEGVDVLDVNVDTVNGRVTLHGEVQSEAEREKAAEVARDIDGVTEVNNQLQVVPKREHERVEASDAQLKDRVAERLDRDPTLDDSDIEVEAVHDGTVVLAGDAKTLSDHLRAVEVAGDVPGVQHVSSEIQSPNQIADDEIYHDLESPTTSATQAANAVASAVTDTWTTTATKMRLLSDPDVPGLDINVDTRDGVVTLFGVVGSPQAKSQAEAAANGTAGVREVRNELQVVPEARQELVERQDDELDDQIASALDRDPRLENTDIDVAVSGGVARLTGTVDSQADRLTAAVVARGVPGVRAVQNDLDVSS